MKQLLLVAVTVCLGILIGARMTLPAYAQGASAPTQIFVNGTQVVPQNNRIDITIPVPVKSEDGIVAKVTGSKVALSLQHGSVR